MANRGMNARLSQTSEAVGTAIRNLKIPLNEVDRAIEIISHGVNEWGLDIGESGRALPSLLRSHQPGASPGPKVWRTSPRNSPL